MNESNSQTKNTIFLKIELIFKGGSGPLQIDVAQNIQTPKAIYTISIEPKSKQLMISSIFKCDIFPKTFLSFSCFPEEKQICLDNEKDAKIKEFFDTNYNVSKEEIDQVFKLIRWKYLIGNNKLEYHSENIFWSLDNKVWKSVVRCPAIENLNVSVYNQTPLDANMIKELLQNGIQEPIFLEILREANSISYTNLESGFVIAVSALEVAVKFLVKNHIPKTEWLMDEIPSPPIHNIICEFFPQLIPGFILRKDESSSLKSIITLRNQILHRGKVGNDRKTLFKMMSFINNFILNTININLKY